MPQAIEQLGAKLTFIDQDELAGGDLSKYDVIVTGVRAYERRADLRAYNQRLLDYAARGGTVIVQYNKMEFNQARVRSVSGEGQRQSRVRRNGSGQNAGARSTRSSITRTRSGRRPGLDWVQERGLYFLGEKDREVRRPGLDGGFVQGQSGREARVVGRRRRSARAAGSIWALGLWRQLPAGTDGAYQLLANLISLPKAPAKGIAERKTAALGRQRLGSQTPDLRLKQAGSP